MNIIEKLVQESKYKTKCPYAMTPTRIVIHNTANDASASDEIAYMTHNNKETSFHYAVDDTGAVQGIPLNRNSWNAGDGNGKGNREGISIEICYSKSGGERWLKAVENAAELTAMLLGQYGWGIDKVTKHEDYSPKHCPHRILDEYGWNNFLSRVQYYMTGTESVKPKQNHVHYQTWDDVKNTWLPFVRDLTDYAGVFGHDVCAVFAKLDYGDIFYRVHVKGGGWLPTVRNCEDYAGIKNKPIDGLMVRTNTGSVHYAVHLRRKKKWLPFVDGFDPADPNNGYAGIIGQEIDAVKIYMD